MGNFFFGDLAFAQQQLDMAVIAGTRQHLAVTNVIDAAVADVRPVRCTFLDQAHGDGGARPRVDALAVAEPRHVVVRPAQRQMQEADRIEHRQRRLAEGIEQALERGVGGAAAIGMAAHAIDDHEQRGLIGRGDGDAVLVVFAVTDQTQICMLDPQARAPAAKALQLLHFHASAKLSGRRFIAPRARTV